MYVVHRKPKPLKISILTYVTTDLFIKKQTKRLRKWMSNTQKIRTAYTQQVWKLNDRISILELQMKPQYVCTQNGKAKITISKKEEKYTSAIKGAKLKILKTPKKYLLKIVNVYAPHSEITITFYNDLNNLLNQINNKSSIAVVDGNFNGETGEKKDIDKRLGIFSGG